MKWLITLIFLFTISLNASEVQPSNLEAAQKKAIKALSKTRYYKNTVGKIEKLLRVKEYANYYTTAGVILKVINDGEISTKKYKFLKFRHNGMQFKPEIHYNIRNKHYGAKLHVNWSF